MHYIVFLFRTQDSRTSNSPYNAGVRKQYLKNNESLTYQNNLTQLFNTKSKM